MNKRWAIVIVPLALLFCSSCNNNNAKMMNNHYDRLNDLNPTQTLEAVTKEKMIELAASKDFWNRKEEQEYEQREKELYGYFERKEQEFSQFFGEPIFKGTMQDPGFPKNYIETFYVPADYLIVWQHAGERYGLSIVHEDREFPFIVAFQRFPKEGKSEQGAAPNP